MGVVIQDARERVTGLMSASERGRERGVTTMRAKRA